MDDRHPKSRARYARDRLTLPLRAIARRAGSHKLMPDPRVLPLPACAPQAGQTKAATASPGNPLAVLWERALRAIARRAGSHKLMPDPRVLPLPACAPQADRTKAATATPDDPLAVLWERGLRAIARRAGSHELVPDPRVLPLPACAPKAGRPTAATATPDNPLAVLWERALRAIARRAGSHKLMPDPRVLPLRGHPAWAASPGAAFGRTRRHVAASLATLLLTLTLLPQAQAEFVSACGSAPSGLNDCPWYQVEIVIFRNDDARASSAEDLRSEAQPRWSPRLATLLPPAGEAISPIRTAEYLALWQSAGQAPEWLMVTPGLSIEQERFLASIEGIGQARHPVDLGFLRDLPQLVWEEPDAQDDPLDDFGGEEPDANEGQALPEIEPVVVIAGPLPTSRPRVELLEVLDMTGAIPMDLAFREVPAGQRLLDTEAARLRRARGFEVLSQLAWRQPFIPNEAGLAQLIYSADLAEPASAASELANGDLLLGTLTVDLRRFLHAHLDLYFKAPASMLEEDSPDSSSEASPEADIDPLPQTRDPAPKPQWIHVQQSRRMRSGELHYLDHPWIGAIIRIEPYEAPAAEE